MKGDCTTGIPFGHHVRHYVPSSLGPQRIAFVDSFFTQKQCATALRSGTEWLNMTFCNMKNIEKSASGFPSSNGAVERIYLPFQKIVPTNQNHNNAKSQKSVNRTTINTGGNIAQNPASIFFKTDNPPIIDSNLCRCGRGFPLQGPAGRLGEGKRLCREKSVWVRRHPRQTGQCTPYRNPAPRTAKEVTVTICKSTKISPPFALSVPHF